MRCDACKNWITLRKTVYGDGWEKATYKAPQGKGDCPLIKLETAADFGCVRFDPVAMFSAGADHVEITTKPDPPWKYFTMIKCPQCSGDPGGGRCLCAGTGLTRRYDDGYVGDERTRRHPKEPAEESAPAQQAASLQDELEALYRKHGLPVPPRVDPGTVLAPTRKADVLQIGDVL